MSNFLHTHFVGGAPDYRGTPRPATAAPEYAELLDQQQRHARAEYRYSSFMADVIRSRDWWRKVATDEEALSVTPEIRELYGRAAAAVGPVLGEAMQEIERHRAAISATADRLKALDIERAARDPRADQRPQLDAIRDDLRRKMAASDDGCCGEGTGSNGVCLGVGVCPRVESAKRCEKFAAGYMRWLEQINDETALAGDSARLGDDVSISDEVHDG